MRRVPTDFSARIAELQPPRQYDIEGRARHDAEMAEAGYRAGEAPARDSDPHAALNDHRIGGFGRRFKWQSVERSSETDNESSELCTSRRQTGRARQQAAVAIDMTAHAPNE